MSPFKGIVRTRSTWGLGNLVTYRYPVGLKLFGKGTGDCKIKACRQKHSKHKIIRRMWPNRHNMWILRHGMHIFRHGIIIFNKESIHRGAPRPCGARPKAAPMLSLLNLIIPCLNMCILCLNIHMLCLFGHIFRIILCLVYFCRQAFILQSPVFPNNSLWYPY